MPPSGPRLTPALQLVIPRIADATLRKDLSKFVTRALNR